MEGFVSRISQGMERSDSTTLPGIETNPRVDDGLFWINFGSLALHSPIRDSDVRAANGGDSSTNRPGTTELIRVQETGGLQEFTAGSMGEGNIAMNLGVGNSTRSQGNTYYNFPASQSLPSNNPMILNGPMNPFRGIETNGLHTSFDAAQRSSLRMGRLLWVDRESVSFQETLGNVHQRVRRPQTLFSQYQGCFLELMTNDKMSLLFEKLLDECDDLQLDYLVQEVLWRNTGSFLGAAFCKVGSSSINKLIKRIKKTDHAYAVTILLSTRLYDMMVDYTARMVIKQCLYQFGSKPNEVLYRTVILNHRELAIDEVGCRSLNECISAISGNHKLILLRSIADNAVFLSLDSYGNYVVQEALLFGHEEVILRILFCLSGHFVRLSQEKGGSHVVEKCVRSSLGMILVVREILHTPSTPFQLARHQYGNYVIQAVLTRLKRSRDETLYLPLVKALQPRFAELRRNPGGRRIINLITSDIETPYINPYPEYRSMRTI